VPFTLAHPAAVLPLRGVRYLRTAPLILGAMSPDTPYFVPKNFGHFWPLPETHTIAGSVSTDLLLAYAGLIALFVLRAPLTALMTARARWLCLAALAPFGQRREWLLAPLAMVLGVWTHLAWDSFTHPDGWMVHRVAALNDPVIIGFYHGHVYHVLQYASSLFGLAVLAWWYRRLPTPRTAPTPRNAPRSAVRPVLLLIAAAALLVGGVQATRYFLDSGPPGQGTVYRTVAILLTHSLTWFALLYLLAGTIVTLERTHERVSRDVS
jgi:hypothetical protein